MVKPVDKIAVENAGKMQAASLACVMPWWVFEAVDYAACKTALAFYTGGSTSISRQRASIRRADG
jgi:hypothetical protein